ncbi:hypothetical protein Barb4_02656 [Bacteroidales bacterium Barb4]|nr:hypothetical protein Barb4_02656 [Bacteroidales bacterium Barb4]
MTVIYSVQAKEAIGFYYENYACNPYGGTDMRRRADDVSRIRSVLSDVLIHNPYKRDGRQFVRIKGIGVAEFEISDDRQTVAVLDILFKD